MAQRVQAVVQVTSDRKTGRSILRGASDVLRPGWESLASTDLSIWLALRRVNEGGVALLEECYYHHGRAVPHYLNAPLAKLVETERLALVEAGPDTVGIREVTLTDQGRELYAVLCGKRGVCPGSPATVCAEWTAQE